ncbi:beta-1,3-galactosyltransferase brn-like [Saccostrea cucullata]|uniref:beta-1,3-galactosyltransferase brn-like n=1 Tax=Saccostrea cuccullata TaxID=36930 RepID=UPI002ED3FB03
MLKFVGLSTQTIPGGPSTCMEAGHICKRVRRAILSIFIRKICRHKKWQIKTLCVGLVIFIVTKCFSVRNNEIIFGCETDFGYTPYKFKNLNNISIDPLNVHPFRYKFVANTVCEKNEDIYLLTLVKSATHNYKNRLYIRQTWGKEAKSENRRLVFILGYSEVQQASIEYENQVFKDIIQEDFQDNYWSNTYKMEMAFSWITKYCNSAKYVLFVDDDMFVNMENSLKYLSSVDSSNVEYLYSGYLVEKPFPTRDYTNKHYVSWEDYPFDCFPPYIPSGTVFFNKAAINTFQKVIPYIPHFREDDVYLGIVAQKVGIVPSDISFLIRLGDGKPHTKFIPCFISDHGYSNADFFQEAYRELQTNTISIDYIMKVCVNDITRVGH